MDIFDDLTSPTKNPFGFLRAINDMEYHRRFIDIDSVFYSGETLSHYTDLNGLFGIVESGSFWLSDHRFLNDKEEFENGRKLTIRLLNDLAKKPLYKTFSSILNGAARYLVLHKETPSYICSFSRLPDSLEQWRSYGKNGQGVSIVFKNSANHFTLLPVLNASKVVYKDSEKIRQLISLIRKYRIEHGVDVAYSNHIDEDDWSSEIARWLAINFINFKHPSYESEQEIRLLASGAHINHFSSLKHRVGQYGIIPYLCAGDQYDSYSKQTGASRLLPIVEVKVGPAVNQDVLVLSIDTYLKNKGYKDVLVTKSEIPYRG